MVSNTHKLQRLKCCLSCLIYEQKELDQYFAEQYGADVTAELDSQLEIFLGYEGKFRKDYQDHTGLINAKYKF